MVCLLISVSSLTLGADDVKLQCSIHTTTPLHLLHHSTRAPQDYTCLHCSHSAQ